MLTDPEWTALRAEWELLDSAVSQAARTTPMDYNLCLLKRRTWFDEHSATLRAEIDALRERVRELEAKHA